jgi:hypothetical protein
MKLSISKGNTKIGGVPNVSLLPGVSCKPGVPCFTDGCYAKKALMYPNVKKAWGGNTELALSNPGKFFNSLWDYFTFKSQPKRFRWHVSGDILDQEYYNGMEDLAGWFGDISFLCFTKQYDLHYNSKPDNLNIVLSTWPNYPLPTNTDLSWAWIEGDPRIPKDQYYLRCPGNCSECEYKCWNILTKDIHVVFPKH